MRLQARRWGRRASVRSIEPNHTFSSKEQEPIIFIELPSTIKDNKAEQHLLKALFHICEKKVKTKGLRCQPVKECCLASAEFA